MDLMLSLAAIVVLLPVLLGLAALIAVKLGRPVIFMQRRPGLSGKPFTLYKFRTMTEEKGADGKLLPDEIRLTRFGRFLRSSSLDELPEFFNIIKGDMSLIGPRPLLTKYLPLYNEQQMRRHEARPGLSGLAQVAGRNDVGWEKRFALDVEYVDHITFLGDWKIIFLTLKKVLAREGIHSRTASTMEEFSGNETDQ